VADLFMIQTAHFIDGLTPDGQAMGKLPHPVFATADGKVKGREDAVQVIGFQSKLEVQNIDLWWRKAVQNPEKAVGMYLVTANKQGTWESHLTEVTDFEPVTR
jgi:hypothetical protein